MVNMDDERSPKNSSWSSPYRCVAKTAKMLVNMKKRMRERQKDRRIDLTIEMWKQIHVDT